MTHLKSELLVRTRIAEGPVTGPTDRLSASADIRHLWSEATLPLAEKKLESSTIHFGLC